VDLKCTSPILRLTEHGHARKAKPAWLKVGMHLLKMRVKLAPGMAEGTKLVLKNGPVGLECTAMHACSHAFPLSARPHRTWESQQEEFLLRGCMCAALGT
jgi:predicted glycoside hydrolase/deacetylase ChbG (UPF0249 family)